MGRFRRSNGGGDTGSSRGDSRWLGALTNSNSEINQRMGSVEKELTLVIQILNRLESHVLGDKEKGIASSPPSQSKVPITHSQNEPGSEELGYQSNHNSFATRDRLLKKIEVPVFDGSMPYG